MYALSPFTMHGGWTIWELRIRMTPIAYLVGATPTIPLFYSIRREEEKEENEYINKCRNFGRIET